MTFVCCFARVFNVFARVYYKDDGQSDASTNINNTNTSIKNVAETPVNLTEIRELIEC